VPAGGRGTRPAGDRLGRDEQLAGRRHLSLALLYVFEVSAIE
jgi:hypothetical protein